MKFSLIENRIAGLLIGTVGALAFFSTANDGAGYGSPGGAIGLAIALVLVVVAVRGARLAVVVAGNQIQVNLFSTRTLLRSEVDRIELRPGTANPPRLIKAGGASGSTP